MKIEKLTVGFINTNCYIAYNGKDAVVFDPGAEAEKILQKAEELGVSIKAIILTHAHFDHVLAADEIRKKTGAKLISTAGERERLCSAELSGHTMLRRREFHPLVADMEVSDGEEIAFGEMKFKVMITPGHTEGSACFISGDVMFSGDTLFFDSCGRCDLAGGNIDDMMKTLKRLATLSGDFCILPGHGEGTTLSRERAENPYMVEAIAR